MEAEQEDADANGLVLLLDVHRAELLRFLTARCGSPDEAEDMVQEMWIKVSGQATGPITNGRAYLFRMANNLVLDRARGRQRSMRRERVWLESEDGGVARMPEDRTDPGEPADEVIARRQEAQVLRDAIADLPPGAQRALRLYRFEDKGQKEIAEIMGISRSGVEKHLALAMKRLREALADCGSFEAAPSMTHGAQGGRKPRMEQGQ
ncbi:RNA polymerase sigma factor [Novosphingobium mangrovi (ex Huang et al. 2023)]|uniref:RNA polymerase sigma factor n=1 Tax=Novosphingobium mangrovi (ex Huang et al. 2023) TaxID=2976432 RepID=A0ABT2I072_9SPHN|nr:RNA polymerase sigma factor [Novosphingobium mangrovi (ex Huang et al. 2023)]MCT2398196.1 RNA polymerase sigma factor [Novosphingobium mangrovi (ex Huang et al. 2023)]